MPRTCTICEHPQKEEIDSLIINGNTFRNIVEQFSLSLGAIHRHKSEHLIQTLTKAREVKEIVHADNLLEQLRNLQAEALSILEQAKKKKDLRTAVFAINSARGVIELLGKLLGELREHPQVNVLISPEWKSLRATILQAIEPYPEAKISITKALENLTDGSDS